LEAVFRERNIRFASKIYANQGHGFRDEALSDSIARMTDFLDANIASPK